MKPSLDLKARPAGLTFRTPQSALDRWDPTLVAMKAAAPEEGEIQILGQIGPEMWGGIDSNMVAGALKAIGRAPLRVVLNSPGGDAIEGIAIYNLLADHQAKVTMHVIGEAASAGSVIAMAGDRIEMGEAALMMIHEGMGIVMGRADDMDEMSAFLRLVNGAVAELYANRSGQKLDDVLAMMNKETWMTAKDAVAKGFADVAIAKDSKKKSYASAAMAALKESIFARKSAQALLAASGDMPRFAVRMSSTSPGAPGSKSKGKAVQTTAQTIAAFEAKRAANAARMEAIMAAATDAGRSLDETESQEYDGIAAEVETVDAHILRLKKHEAVMLNKATAITKKVTDDPAAGSAARANSGIISVTQNVEKGIKMARFVMAQIRANGDMRQAMSIYANERRWMDQTPEVHKVFMAAVAAGDTTTAGWASELVYAENLANEFIELLRPATVIGKIPGLTNVPFNIRIGSQTAGGTGFWVGQGKPVPVSKLTTGSTTLGIAKAAGLNVIDEELARSSSPSAEMLVRNDLIKTNATFIDVQFLDPGVAAVANVSPASITSGVTPTAATGTASANLRADVQTLFGLWITANLDPSKGVWIMPATTALSISLMLNALGQPVFPSITMNGGTFFGLPVVTSQSAVMVGSPVAGEGNMIILLNAPEILLADDGQMVITVSNQASLEMLDNPTNASTATVTATSMVSMFQTNSLAIKGIRWINWAKKRTTAVQYIKDAAYVT